MTPDQKIEYLRGRIRALETVVLHIIDLHGPSVVTSLAEDLRNCSWSPSFEYLPPERVKGYQERLKKLCKAIETLFDQEAYMREEEKRMLIRQLERREER